VLLARKLIFLTKKQLFHLQNLSTRSNFFAEFFQPQNRDSPFPFKDVPSPVFVWGLPFGNGDLFFLSPYGNRDSPFTCFHMGIPVWKCFWRPKFLAMQWRLVRDLMASQNYSPHFHTGSPHMETRRQTKKFSFGDYLFTNRVCAHLGINIYSQ
jgi:hypothetical protein